MSTTTDEAVEAEHDYLAPATAADEPVSAELALAIRDERDTAVQPQTTLPSPREWEATMAIAKQIAATPFVPESYRNQPEAVVAAILTGRELGIGPMQALRDIHMVDGRPAFAAQLMLAKMRQGGIVLLETDSTDERAWIKARRPDTGEVGEFEFTIKEAEVAGLLAKAGKSWTKYRKDMLWARAVSRMARRFGSDLLGGLVYSKEELDDLDDDKGGYGGGGTGYAASPFDPAKQLLPKAPQGEQYAQALHASQELIASDLDWPAILAEASLASIGPREQWGDAAKSEFRHRWANTITHLLELCETEGAEHWHPELGLQNVPQADELIVKAFEWGFDVTPSLPLKRVEQDVIDADATDVTDEPDES
jgi:hypothetical protein